MKEKDLLDELRPPKADRSANPAYPTSSAGKKKWNDDTQIARGAAIANARQKGNTNWKAFFSKLDKPKGRER